MEIYSKKSIFAILLVIYCSGLVLKKPIGEEDQRLAEIGTYFCVACRYIEVEIYQDL